MTKAIIAVLIIASISFLLPIMWSFSTAFKPTGEILSYPPTLIPQDFTFDQFIKLFTAGNGLFGKYILNTLFMAGVSILGVMIVSLLSGYALSMLPFKGSNLVLLLILSIMMVPFQSLLIPIYDLLNKIGLFDTRVGLILVYMTFFMPFCIFMVFNYFRSLPKSLRESARIDGAGEMTILFKILVPLSLPALATIIVYVFLEVWNDFVLSLIFSSSPDVRNIQVGITVFATQRFSKDWGLINAGVVFSLIPSMLVFLILQKYYVKGLTSGTVKG